MIRTTGSTNLYSSIVSMASGGRTRIHHHGPCETSFYIRSGGARYTWGPTGLEDCPDGWSCAWTTIRTGRGHAGAVLTAAGLDTSVEALPARHGLASIPKEPFPRDARATEAAERCLA